MATRRWLFLLLLLLAPVLANPWHHSSPDLADFLVEPNGQLRILGGQLQMKATDGVLLLKNRARKEVYSYSKGTLKRCPGDKWSESKSDILDETTGLVIEHQEYAEKVPFKGAHLVDMKFSPDGRMLAVLSADGERPPSLMPFLASSSARGTHYLETFRLDGLNLDGRCVIPRQKPNDWLTLYWPANGTLVCSATDFRYLVFYEL